VHRSAERSEPREATSSTSGLRAFSRDLSRLLFTFFGVAAIDLIFGSVLTGKVRLWFPQWLDPQWATNPDAHVVYSQSYLSGVFLTPVLAWIIDRDFLAPRGGPIRIGFWAVCLPALLVIIIWKGELMLAHDKQTEAIAFAVLTVFIYAFIVVTQALPVWLAKTSARDLLRRLLLGLAAFFLVMSVLDPVLQVGVQGMEWSRGLIVEMVFFIPAGLTLLLIARAMKRNG
jgi:hypothetical protein